MSPAIISCNCWQRAVSCHMPPVRQMRVVRLAYSDGKGSPPYFRRTIRKSADFSGRARRTEGAIFWIATAFLGAGAGSVIMQLLEGREAAIAHLAVQSILFVPAFALFARRLHDQDRSGWWTLLLPVAIILSIPGIGRTLRSDPVELVAYTQAPMTVLDWLMLAASISIIVLFLIPGKAGPNAHGSDPRLENA